MADFETQNNGACYQIYAATDPGLWKSVAKILDLLALDDESHMLLSKLSVLNKCAEQVLTSREVDT